VFQEDHPNDQYSKIQDGDNAGRKTNVVQMKCRIGPKEGNLNVKSISKRRSFSNIHEWVRIDGKGVLDQT